MFLSPEKFVSSYKDMVVAQLALARDCAQKIDGLMEESRVAQTALSKEIFEAAEKNIVAATEKFTATVEDFSKKMPATDFNDQVSKYMGSLNNPALTQWMTVFNQVISNATTQAMNSVNAVAAQAPTAAVVQSAPTVVKKTA